MQKLLEWALKFVSLLLHKELPFTWFYPRQQDLLVSSHHSLKTVASNNPFQDLPWELVTHIMRYLEWRDVLMLRMCNRRFSSISRERSIWLSLLYKYRGTLIPQSTQLPHPLEKCSSAELEKAVTGWFNAGRRNAQPLRRDDPTIACSRFQFSVIPNVEAWLPGSPSVIFIDSEGTGVFLYDTRHPTKHPVLIIPASKPNSVVRSVHVENCLPHHPQEEAELQLQSVKIAVVSWIPDPTRGFDGRFTHIEIWELSLERLDGETNGYTGTTQLLTSFRDGRRCRGLSLYGNYFAYEVVSTSSCYQAFCVVDWSQPECSAQPKSFKFERFVFRNAIGGGSAILIPDDRLVVTYGDWIIIWNWRRDGHRFYRSIPLLLDVPCSNPVWSQQVYYLCITNYKLACFFLQDSVRFAVPTKSGVSGVIVPCFKRLVEGASVECVPLVRNCPMRLVEYARSDGYYGLRSGIETSGGSTRLLTWSWPDDPDFGLGFKDKNEDKDRDKEGDGVDGREECVLDFKLARKVMFHEISRTIHYWVPQSGFYKSIPV